MFDPWDLCVREFKYGNVKYLDSMLCCCMFMTKCRSPTRQPLERYRLHNKHWRSVEHQFSSITLEKSSRDVVERITTETATENVAMPNDEEQQ
jgi:hypothetical protein